MADMGREKNKEKIGGEMKFLTKIVLYYGLHK